MFKRIWPIILVLSCLSALAQDNQKQRPFTAANYSGLFYDAQSNQYFINDKISFSIRPSKEEKYLDKIEYSVDNGPYQEYKGKIKFQNDGFHIVRFRAVDPVLNWSPTQNFRIYVDLTSPQTTLDWNGQTYATGQELYVSKNAKMVLSAQDNLSGISKILWKKAESAPPQEYTGELNFPAGKHQVWFAAVDNVGNQEKWTQYSFIVDSEVPTSQATVKGNSFLRNKKLFIDKGSFVAIKAEDKSSGIDRIEYKINDSKPALYKQKILVDQQATEIQYRSIDKVSNREEWKKIKIYLDSNPPQLKVDTKGKHQRIAGKIFARAGFSLNVNVSDDESGTKNLLVDNNDPVKEGKKEFVFDQEGEHSLNLSAEDDVGNIANLVSYTIVIDEGAPESRLTTSNEMIQKDGVLITSLPNKIEFSADDKGVGVDRIEMSYDGKKFEAAPGLIDLASWKNTKRTVYYRSIDKLGNMEPVKQTSILVRKRGPDVNLYVEKEDLPALPLSEVAKVKVKEKRSKNKKSKK
ncbi:MAG: OmpL47-type beta-barrel domain-containing protein [Bacteriovoracia bacterium]